MLRCCFSRAAICQCIIFGVNHLPSTSSPPLPQHKNIFSTRSTFLDITKIVSAFPAPPALVRGTNCYFIEFNISFAFPFFLSVGYELPAGERRALKNDKNNMTMVGIRLMFPPSYLSALNSLESSPTKQVLYINLSSKLNFPDAHKFP